MNLFHLLLPCLLNPMSLFIYGVLFFILYRKLYPIIRKKYYTIENYKDFQTLQRDINCNYNPSIVSMLIDNNIEIKDIVADIMNLYAKKYIVLDNDLNSIKINEKKITLT
ncbi:MAG: hypothetical protein J5507_02950 [Clostridia bacterium]|nr:hypothetical protein [Clostridia bacterium]